MKINDLKTALHNYFQSLNRFKELGVVTNKNDFTSQIGEWLFVSMSDKIDELKKLQSQRSLNNLKELNIGRQLSNLLYKMKLLTLFLNN